MFRKTMTLVLAAALLFLSVSAAAAEPGLFGELAQSEGADERLAVLDEIAETISVYYATDRMRIEVSQAYYEGNRIFISYRADGDRVMIQDGLDLGEDSYADIIAGDEAEQEDGSRIGWKECIVPEEEAADPQTFSLVFRESGESGERSRLSFTVKQNGYSRILRGVSPAEAYQAEAELSVGKADIKGVIRVISPEQAASWIAWQEGEEETGTDVIVCWNLYQNGGLVSPDLYGASMVSGTDGIIFDGMYPCINDLSGLALVPEYSEGGDCPEETIALEPAWP